jgi:hypothetical protein
MALGPGKYDALATQARLGANARAVILIVIGGDQGGGFSLQTVDPDLITELPAILRGMADQIEHDLTSVLGSK